MTPRKAGILLLLLSVAAGAFAGWAISVPPWSIPSALLLTVATVTAFVGLLWLFRHSWDDPTWPPAPPELAPAVRNRRNARRFGVVLLALTLPLLALTVWSATTSDFSIGQLLRPGLAVLAFTAFGVALVRFGRSPIAARADDEDGTVPADTPANADGWRRLGRIDGALSASLAAPVLVFSAILVPWRLADAFSDDPLWATVIGIGVIAAAGVIAWLVVRARHPQVFVHPGRQEVRAGRSITPWSAVTSAEVKTSALWPGAGRTLILLLRDDSGMRVPLILRRRGRRGLSAAESDLAAEMIEASAVELPRAKEDPHGRFSRFTFPTHVSREDALDLIRTPPGDDDPLPVQTA